MVGALVVLAAITLLVVSAAPASPSQSPLTARPFPAMLGVVPSARHAAASPHRPTANDVAGTSFASSANLIYHGGQVLHSSQTYAIYWGSSSSSTYRGLINGFFQNVATDSGRTTNVYSTATQYGDGAGLISYTSSFGGSYVDSTTPIPDHCSAEYSGTGIVVSGCVTDDDIQAEVAHAISAAGWTAGPNKIFFIFTPPNVGSCYDTTSQTCAYVYYCAYHSWIGSGSGEVFYTNQPYTDSSAIGAPGACDSGQHPNNDWADATINVASHEHNETISDPDGAGWYDSSGNEMADKCAWTFGTTIGSTPAGAYNQAIGTGTYYLQREWSNASSSCVLGYAGAQPSVTGFSPKKGSPGDGVSITGTNFDGATVVAFDGVPASFTISSSTTIVATVPAGAGKGSISVTTGGGFASSAGTFKAGGVGAGPPPGGSSVTIASFTPGKGGTGSLVTIAGTGFTGATAVTVNGAAASFTVQSATQITATVPAGAAKKGSITVTAPGGTATSAGSFKTR